MHKDDVLSDPIIQAAAMVCLTETSISDSNWVGWKQFTNFTSYHVSRKDCTTEREDLRKSGGVAVLINNNYQSGRIEEVEDKNLEMVCTITKVGSVQIMASGIYKDHNMSKKDFLSKIENVFDDHRTFFEEHSTSLSIIMGDFNLYDENGKSLKNLNTLAIQNGFIPLINKGTTINGHLLDQIFITDTGKNRNHQKTVILPSYFSDHNLVVLCLEK